MANYLNPSNPYIVSSVAPGQSIGSYARPRVTVTPGASDTGDLSPAYSGWTAAYGGIPTVPSPISTAGTAITGNLANLSDLYQLSGNVNAFNIGEAAAPYAANLPNYQAMIEQSSGNILSRLKGEVPTDVVNQLVQNAAERGIMTGSTGGPNENAAYLRALGLTSLGLQTQAEGELTGAIGRTPVPQLFNPSTFFVTPEQQQQAQLAANIYGAAPNPAAAAIQAQQTAQQAYNQGAAGGATTVGPAPVNWEESRARTLAMSGVPSSGGYYHNW